MRTLRLNGRVRPRFRVSPYTNPATSTQSWRVHGYKLDGARVRENFADHKSAQCRQIELETEALARQSDTAIRATKLSETQLRLAETAFLKLEDDADLLRAADYWNKHGRKHSIAESPQLDEGFEAFKAWVTATETIRAHSKKNLLARVRIFVNSTTNVRLSDITPEQIEGFLAGRRVGAITQDNDRRAISRFLGWSMERPRRWLAINPAHQVRVERGERLPPAILNLDECKRMLSEAKARKDGALVPYVSVCLFGGLRPEETARLKWQQVNLKDGEIRLEGWQTKTGTPRVVMICETLKTWLRSCEGKPFFPPNWRRDFDAIKKAAGYGTPAEEAPKLKPWPKDVMRHTAVSHYFRKTGSYGQTAEQFGNSEATIKKHYQGRVSSGDTEKFFALKP